MKGDVFYIPSATVTDEDKISFPMFLDAMDPRYE
jgi:hypothetical protein